MRLIEHTCPAYLICIFVTDQGMSFQVPTRRICLNRTSFQTHNVAHYDPVNEEQILDISVPLPQLLQPSQPNSPFDFHNTMRHLDRLKPVVTISARDTEHPALEIHSTTPAWPGAELRNAKRCWATRRREETVGRTPVPPTPKLTLGPTGATRAGNAGGVPPLPSGRHATPVRRRRRSGPSGARARRAKRGSRDSAVRAQMGPAAGS
jgi:hypothetical protein